MAFVEYNIPIQRTLSSKDIYIKNNIEGYVTIKFSLQFAEKLGLVGQNRRIIIFYDDEEPHLWKIIPSSHKGFKITYTYCDNKTKKEISYCYLRSKIKIPGIEKISKFFKTVPCKFQKEGILLDLSVAYENK